MAAEHAERRRWAYLKRRRVRWRHEQAHKATAEQDNSKLCWLDAHLAGKELDTINRDMIGRITQARLADRCSNATVTFVCLQPGAGQQMARDQALQHLQAPA